MWTKKGQLFANSDPRTRAQTSLFDPVQRMGESPRAGWRARGLPA